MQIKRQNLQKKSYQTVLFCNFQQLKPSYFAYFATINCTTKKHPRYLPRVQGLQTSAKAVSPQTYSGTGHTRLLSERWVMERMQKNNAHSL